MHVPQVPIIVGQGQSMLVLDLGDVVGCSVKPGHETHHYEHPFQKSSLLDTSAVKRISCGIRSKCPEYESLLSSKKP
jgi:hypothetical protein